MEDEKIKSRSVHSSGTGNVERLGSSFWMVNQKQHIIKMSLNLLCTCTLASLPRPFSSSCSLLSELRTKWSDCAEGKVCPPSLSRCLGLGLIRVLGAEVWGEKDGGESGDGERRYGIVEALRHQTHCHPPCKHLLLCSKAAWGNLYPGPHYSLIR